MRNAYSERMGCDCECVVVINWYYSHLATLNIKGNYATAKIPLSARHFRLETLRDIYKQASPCKISIDTMSLHLLITKKVPHMHLTCAEIYQISQ